MSRSTGGEEGVLGLKKEYRGRRRSTGGVKKEYRELRRSTGSGEGV